MERSMKQFYENQLRSKMAEMMADQRDQGALKIEAAADPFDQIQASVERDLLVGLLNRDAQLRDDLRRAFEMLRDGSFGTCEDCGEMIAAARLRAIPWARRCVSCQEVQDREAKLAHSVPEAA
jgi:RNA polymerase-binding protein DksA